MFKNMPNNKKQRSALVLIKRCLEYKYTMINMKIREKNREDFKMIQQQRHPLHHLHHHHHYHPKKKTIHHPYDRVKDLQS